MKKIKASLVMVFGIIAMSIAITICSQVSLGTAPCTTLNLGLSNKLSISFGMIQLLVNLFFMIFVIIYDRKMIGLGTIVNMVGIGFLVDFFTPVYKSIVPYTDNIQIRLLLLAFGILVQTFGTSLYLTANLGASPYDALTIILSKKTKISFGCCRAAADIACVAAGYMFGSAIGIGTVILAFFTGPLVALWNKKVSKPLMDKLTLNEAA